MSNQPTGTQLQVANTGAIKKDLGLEIPKLGDNLNTDEELNAKADEFVRALLQLNPEDLKAKNDGKESVESMGVDLQKKAAHQSAMLKQPVKDLARRSEDGGDVANSLIKLKMEVEALDPGKFDFEPGWITRTLGFIPGIGTPIKKYFSKYESAQTVIAAIVRSLENGRDQLGRDNITLFEDQKIMHELSLKLANAVKLAMLIDQKLQTKLDRELTAGSEQYIFVAEELLFPLRQRIMDLQQQLAVNQQGVLATEIIMRNNKELMRGVNRALNVTVSALQVGATVALALENQKVVLDKVENVNKTTSDLIAGTAARLKTQGVQIQKQAASSQLSIESLQKAFADIKGAMDDISRFRVQALPQMAKAVLELDQLTDQSAKTIEKMKKGNLARPKIAINLDDK